MTRTSILTALMLSLNWYGCKVSSTETPPPGAYAYTSYDSSNVPIVSGWFTLINSDSAHVTGEWHLKATGGALRIGPQSGDGKLVGGTNGDRLWIELNPQVRNNNLQLNGVFSKESLTGQWTWISNEGIANQGSFRAIKK